MNEMIRICRSMAKSEYAIRRLHKNVACMAVGGLFLTALIATQNGKIEALQKKVADLEAKTNGTTEGQTEQKGA